MTSLEMRQGDSWALEVGWFNPIVGTRGDIPDLDSPVDITGYTAHLQIRRSVKAATSMLSLTSPSGGLVVDGPNGTVTALATPTQTAAIAFGSCYWELEITNGTDTYTLDSGLMTVERQLT